MEFYAPEHASKAQNIKEEAVKAALSQRINESLWSEAGKLLDGAAYLAAHLLTKRDQQQNGPLNTTITTGAGPVERITEGEVTIEFGSTYSMTGGEGDGSGLALTDTDYGQAFLDIEKSIPSTPVTTR